MNLRKDPINELIDINMVLKVKNSIEWGRFIPDRSQTKNAQQFSKLLFKAWSFYFEKGPLDMYEEQQFKFDF